MVGVAWGTLIWKPNDSSESWCAKNIKRPLRRKKKMSLIFQILNRVKMSKLQLCSRDGNHIKSEMQGTTILTVSGNKFWVSCYHFHTSCAVCTRFIGMVPKNTIADEKRLLTLLYFDERTLRPRGWGCLYPPTKHGGGLNSATSNYVHSTYVRTRRLTVASSAVGGSLQQPRGCLMVLIVAAVVFGDLQSRLISIGLQSLPARKGRSLCRL